MSEICQENQGETLGGCMGEGPGAGGLGEGPTGTRWGAACLEPPAPGGHSRRVWQGPRCRFGAWHQTLAAQRCRRAHGCCSSPRARCQGAGPSARGAGGGAGSTGLPPPPAAGRAARGTATSSSLGTRGRREEAAVSLLCLTCWNRRCQDTRTHFWGAVTHFWGTGTPFVKGTDHHSLLPEAQRWLRTPDPHVPQRTCPRMPEYF